MKKCDFSLFKQPVFYISILYISHLDGVHLVGSPGKTMQWEHRGDAW